MIKQEVLVKQPRIKADGSASLTCASLYELSEHEFNVLNKLTFDKTECFLIVVDKDKYIDFILSEAKRIADMG